MNEERRVTEERRRELQEENRRLKRAVDELTLLLDLSRAIGAASGTQGIVQAVVERAVPAVAAEHGVVTLVEDEALTTKTLARARPASSETEPLHLKLALAGWQQIHKEPLVLNDPQNDPRFKGISFGASVRS
ncbi:MAG TPA: hypothetical protein VGR00_01545, partial [Thermoanaerobaculia bacterium]|nr:hypothetical protein [Thermoanaerobaculia bacterium]